MAVSLSSSYPEMLFGWGVSDAEIALISPCRMAVVLSISLWTSESIVDVFGYAYRSFILSALAKFLRLIKGASPQQLL
jgi:hypothetical protein